MLLPQHCYMICILENRRIWLENVTFVSFPSAFQVLECELICIRLFSFAHIYDNSTFSRKKSPAHRQNMHYKQHKHPRKQIKCKAIKLYFNRIKFISHILRFFRTDESQNSLHIIIIHSVKIKCLLTKKSGSTFEQRIRSTS